MCDLIVTSSLADLIVTSSLAELEAKIQIKSVLMLKSRLITRKKENVEIKDILHKALSKRLFLDGIHNFLRRADARGSADIIYHI